MRALVCALIVLCVSCAGRSKPFAGVTMPSPDGCFIHVWDAPGFGGTADFINGPRAYRTLRDLPGGRVWNKRIYSAVVGPAATVTLWTDENFQSSKITLMPDTAHRQLAGLFNGETESMDIACD